MTRIGSISLAPPFGVAPMAGMTDTAFRRLVKRQGGCGLVVTEMVSSEGLVRGIDRTLEYAEFTEDERPVSIQIFGGDPDKMADAARIVEGMGADVVDVNMGCPVPKIARHHAGCSLMRQPVHAASIIRAMSAAVKIPVTVKMRAGWNDHQINAPLLAKMVQDAGAAAVTIHGRTAAQSYSGQADWSLVSRVADDLDIPVIGSGDCTEPEHVVERMVSGVDGVLVGRGVLRNPWILAQAHDLLMGRAPRVVSREMRGQFLLDYIDLLLGDAGVEASGFGHLAPTAGDGHATNRPAPAQGREKWVINKLRALNAWYSKGYEGGAQFRIAINHCHSIAELRDLVHSFFFAAGPSAPDDARYSDTTSSGVLASTAS